jgi:simple sugar transport system permease protein
MNAEMSQKRGRTKLKFVKVDGRSPWVGVLAVVSALIAGLAMGALAITLTDVPVLKAYGALFNGAFGNWNAVMQTMLQATPLLFTGLAAVVAFRGKIWNIGGEGQFLAGAMMASWVSMRFFALPHGVLVPIVILFSMLGGAVWAGIAGYLRAKFKVNEIIVTVMLNYIIEFILSYLLQNNWADPGTAYIQTIRFGPASYFPLLFGTRLHFGVILAVLFAVIIYILLWKTPLGFEIRSIGANPVASKYKGINVTRTILITMLISGALAGLGGGTEIAGVHHRLRMDISAGYGFTGILVAMTGQLHPLGAIIAAIFFGALVNGSYMMQISSRVPFALVNTLQGIILFFLVVAFVLSQYRIIKVKIDE